MLLWKQASKRWLSDLLLDMELNTTSVAAFVKFSRSCFKYQKDKSCELVLLQEHFDLFHKSYKPAVGVKDICHEISKYGNPSVMVYDSSCLMDGCS